MRRLWRMVLVVALVTLVAACGREASVELSDGAAAESSGERSMTGDPNDTQGGMEPGTGEDPEKASADGTDAAAAAGTSAEEPRSVAPREPAATRPAPSQGASTPGSTGGGASGGGSAPNQGIAVGEPNPGDPDGCPECTTSTEAPHPEPEPTRSPPGGYTTPRPGQEDVRARPWDSAEVADDGVTVTISWWSGVEPCSVLDRVEVHEAADKVVITLYEGNAPGDEGDCPAIAVEKRTQVRLSAPVAGRPIVDGAKTTA